MAYLELGPSADAYNVWIVDLSSHGRQLVLSEAAARSSLPLDPVAWSQATNELILNAFVPDSDLAFQGLWAMNLTSRALTELETGPEPYSSLPVLSPDGATVAFSHPSMTNASVAGLATSGRTALSLRSSTFRRLSE